MEHVRTELVTLILRPYNSVLENIVIMIALNAKLLQIFISFFFTKYPFSPRDFLKMHFTGIIKINFTSAFFL